MSWGHGRARRCRWGNCKGLRGTGTHETRGKLVSGLDSLTLVCPTATDRTRRISQQQAQTSHHGIGSHAADCKELDLVRFRGQANCSQVLLSRLVRLHTHAILSIPCMTFWHPCRPTVPAQSNFEKSLWNKTNRMNARQEGEASESLKRPCGI
jgi:hypothetical protein